jgi:hypothetical protein
MPPSPRVSACASPLENELTRICVMLKLAQNGYTTVDESHSGHVNRCFPELGTQRREGVVGLPTHHRRSTTAFLIILLSLTAACTGSDVTTQPLTPAPTPTPSPTSSIDPRALPAVTAYEAFTDAAVNAQRKPIAPGEKWPSGADFTKHSFDPIKTQFMNYIWYLESRGLEYRGTPDTPHISVKSMALDATPWPTVVLTDCQTGGTWDEYVIKTGKRVPLAGNGPAPPPYLNTVKMIQYKGHWGIHSTTADKSRTCTP